MCIRDRHRIGFDPPVIKEQEIRLVGDQDEIAKPSISQTLEKADAYEKIKKAIEILGSPDPKIYRADLQLAAASLAQLSLSNSEITSVLADMQTLLRSIDDMSISDIDKVRNDLISILPEESRSVQSRYTHALDLTKEVTRKLSF